MERILVVLDITGCVRSSAPGLGDRCDCVVDHLNERLFAATDAARDATIFYAVLDPATGVPTDVNARHVSALVVPIDGPAIELGSHAPPIGIFESIAFAAEPQADDLTIVAARRR